MVLTIVLTMIGAPTSYSLIRAIKDNGEKEVKLIGTDPVALVHGAFMVDSFHQVTASFVDEKKYIQELLTVCKKENVNVIIPNGNEDCLAITRNHELFEELGIVIASSSYEILSQAFDKYYAYNTIRETRSKYCPQFYLVRNYDDFIKYSNKLGYPDQKIVLKPRHGRGGRGVYIIDPNINLAEILKKKPQAIYPFEVIEGLIKKEDFEDLLLMEYLPGKIYSVYSLCKDGKSLAIIPNIRIWGNASNTLIGKVELYQDLIDAIRMMNKKFGFSYNINYELAIGNDGFPKVFDLNPRIAASTAIFRNIGINLPYLSIKLALKENFEIPKPKEGIIFLRYLKELNVNEESGEIFEL